MSEALRFKARLLPPDERGKWEEAFQWSATNALPAHHWEWLEAASEGVGAPRRVVVEATDGRIVALLPFVERRIRGLKHWRHPAPATWGGPLLVDPEPSESHLRDVLATVGAFLSRQASLVELLLPPTMEDARGLIWEGWEARPHYNYVSRIANPGDLLRQAENAVRRQHTKALQGGLLFHHGQEWLEGVLELATRTRQRQGFARWVPESIFRKLARQEINGLEGLVAAVTSADGRNVLAGAVLVRHHTTVSYVLGASDLAASGAEGAPTLLQASLTDHCLGLWGPFAYDWVGANTPSVAQFKKKFRPELEVGLRLIRRSGLARILARA